MEDQRYGTWTLLKEVKNFNSRQLCEFQCDCGAKKIFSLHFVLHGRMVECQKCKKVSQEE